MTKKAKTITVSWGRLKRLGKEINTCFWAYDEWGSWGDDEGVPANWVAKDIERIWDMFTKLAPELAEEIEKEGNNDDAERI